MTILIGNDNVGGMMNFAVLASGRGGNLKAIIEAVKKGAIKADLKLVISDKKDAYALEHACQAQISAVFINPKDFQDRESFDRAIVERLHASQIDFVVLAGYMRLVSDYFIGQYPDKILNIHPSLLPDFKGMHAIKEAFDAKVTVTGPTVHFVVREVDSGPIILQEPVRVAPQDTLESLEEKIHQAEHRIYPKAIDLFARGKLKIEGRKVIVL
jgi:phosphoribosylglycinamide formyltransferase 1